LQVSPRKFCRGLEPDFRVALVASVFAVALGCSDTRFIIDAGSLENDGGLDSGALAGPDGAGANAQCRWQGYGVGTSEITTTHALGHAAAICEGRVETSRHRSGPSSTDGMVQEIQVKCCYDNGLPSVGDTPNPEGLDHVLDFPEPGTTQPHSISQANAKCVGQAATLGEWSTIYSDDGLSILRIRFNCF